MNFNHFFVVLTFVLCSFATALLRQICVRELQYLHNGRCCNLCPPGSYKVKDCTSNNHRPECAKCEYGYYLEHPNHAPRCRRCTSCSARAHKEAKTSCRNNQNRVCQCMKGYYIPLGWVLDVCLKHMKCPPGDGVDRRGTRQSNTVCRPCAHGTFSNRGSSRQKCRPWTDCALLGREELEPGISKRDAVCGPKLATTTKSVPPLRSKPQQSYWVFSPKSMSATSSRSSMQQTPDSPPLSKPINALTTVTPSKPQSTSDPMSLTASSTQSVSKMPSSSAKPITPDIKTLLIKAKTLPSPSSDKGILRYNSSTHTLGSTTTPTKTASAHGQADQKSMTSKTNVSYFIRFIVKAKPAITPASYMHTTTGTAHKEETTLLHQPDARDNKVHHGSAQSLQIVPIVITVILSCVLVVVAILAATFCHERCHKKHTNPTTDVPAVHFNNRNGVVTIGAPSQGSEEAGGSGTCTSSNSSGAVHSVQVHEAANLIKNEDDHSPQISVALEERPQEVSMPGEVPDIPITEADLVKLAKTIGPDWEAAGIQVLGITSADLDTFRANNPRNRNMQIFDMLNLWKRNQRKRAVTLRTLCELLTQAEVEYRVQLAQGE